MRTEVEFFYNNVPKKYMATIGHRGQTTMMDFILGDSVCGSKDYEKKEYLKQLVFVPKTKCTFLDFLPPIIIKKIMGYVQYPRVFQSFISPSFRAMTDDEEDELAHEKEKELKFVDDEYEYEQEDDFLPYDELSYEFED